LRSLTSCEIVIFTHRESCDDYTGGCGKHLFEVGPVAKAYDSWKAKNKSPLAPTLDPLDEPQMLRAFRVNPLNVSDIRLDEVFIRVAEGSEFAIN
jgi:hypothetical protein